MIKGTFSRSSVGTLALRKPRFLLLGKMGGNGAEAALKGVSCQMKRLPRELAQKHDPGSSPGQAL